MTAIVKAPTSSEPTALELENRQLAREAAAEGIVLLKNDGVLPLKEKRIALYGAGARMTVKGGRGSGEVRNRSSVSIAEGLENAGFEITTKGWLNGFDKYYADIYEAYRQDAEARVAGLKEFKKIQRAIPPFQHPSGMPVTEADLADCGTAIYVLARQAGESHDRKAEEGDYYLTDVELDNLRFLGSHYSKLAVIVNVGGLIDLSFMDTIPVGALVYFVQGGEEGGNAIARLMAGERNFSGKLTTSWPVDFHDLPSSKNYSYLGEDPYNQEYNEGIFVGYRYFDTFGVRPRYAFGFGMSYTSFQIACEGIQITEDGIFASASVKNDGEFAGREVVQLYVTVPFGSGSEQQRLAAFCKTRLLSPGETEKLELRFSLRELSVYNEEKAAWILRAGNYVLRLGNASDNVTAVQLLTLNQEAILEQCTNICPVKHAISEIQPPIRVEEPLGNLPAAPLDDCLPEIMVHTYETPEEIPDELIRSMTDEQLAKLVIGGTTSPKGVQVSALGASGTTTPELYEELGIPNVILSDGPAGLNLSSHVVQLPDGSVKGANVPENLEAYKRYLFGYNRIAMVSQMAKPEDGVSHYQYATAWPASQLLAQTFDTELLEAVGEGVGKEMEAFGVTIWLAPGMNIDRNPLCGRTFEYYSEDPLVSGKMAAAIVRGVQKHPGKGMSIKHFAANNCELERNRSSSNVNEKTLREIYLRGFEIAVKESEPVTVMASYNKVNGLYTVNNYDLLVKVLRNEWGYEGMVMSDWDSMKADPADPAVPLTGDVQKAHAAQCDLVCPGRPDQFTAIMQGLKDGKVKREDLERSAVRVLRLIRSNLVVESR